LRGLRITIPKEGVANSADDAAKLASGIGFPVVMKIVSPQNPAQDRSGRRHRGREIRGSCERSLFDHSGHARKYDAKAEILGVQVQQMLAGGQEVIIGAVTDPAFGKLVAFGLGGILVEVLKDITFRLAPQRTRMRCRCSTAFKRPRSWRGVRGAKPCIARHCRDDRACIDVGGGFPGNLRNGFESGVCHRERRNSADVRIVLNFNPAPARDRPDQAAIVEKMTRIMKPKAVRGDRRFCRERQNRPIRS